MAAICAIPAGQLRFDRSIESMFTPDDPLIPPYQRLKRTFGGNEVVLAAYLDPQLLTEAGIKRVAQLEQQLQQVPGVEATLSLNSIIGPTIIEPENQMAQRFRDLFAGYTHSTDGQTAAVVCILTPELETEVPRADTIADIRRITEAMPSGVVAGEPVMVVDGFRFLEEDGVRLSYVSTVLLIITIAFCFRSFRWVLIPILVVQLTVLLTRAVLVGFGFRLSMVSSMLTAIITVVGVAAVVHFIVGFRQARATLAPREAVLSAGTILLTPIFWARMTDVFGFGCLLIAGVGPVQDFGTMTGLGALLVMISMALLVPGLSLVGKFDPDPKHAWGEAWLGRALEWCLNLVENRPKTVALVGLLVTVAVGAGSVKLELETDFTRNFRADSSIVKAYNFVETNLGGAGAWDVILPAPAPEELNWAYLTRVLELETRLRKEVPELSKVLSVADGLEAGSPVALKNVRPEFLQKTMIRAGLTTMQTQMPAFYRALYGEDPDHPGQYAMRIMLRAPERQDADTKQKMINQVTQISREIFPEAKEQVEVTGYFVLLTRLIESLVRDQWTTFAVAAGGIGLMMLIAFRSLPLMLIAMVPNVIPIIMVTGLMGWCGLRINMGAAMIAAVSIGLSVDSSIHYIFAYLHAVRLGLSPKEARHEVQQDVGRALFFTTLALIVGFAALCMSEFVPTIYFGALVSLMMLGGMFGNLIVLPLLLKWVTRS